MTSPQSRQKIANPPKWQRLRKYRRKLMAMKASLRCRQKKRGQNVADKEVKTLDIDKSILFAEQIYLSIPEMRLDIVDKDHKVIPLLPPEEAVGLFFVIHRLLSEAKMTASTVDTVNFINRAVFEVNTYMTKKLTEEGMNEKLKDSVANDTPVATKSKRKK